MTKLVISLALACLAGGLAFQLNKRYLETMNDIDRIF